MKLPKTGFQTSFPSFALFILALGLTLNKKNK
ncbi:LPXTG cell wall anchor domain-containing protein [Aerococcus christensenii]